MSGKPCSRHKKAFLRKVRTRPNSASRWSRRRHSSADTSLRSKRSQNVQTHAKELHLRSRKTQSHVLKLADSQGQEKGPQEMASSLWTKEERILKRRTTTQSTRPSRLPGPWTFISRTTRESQTRFGLRLKTIAQLRNALQDCLKSVTRQFASKWPSRHSTQARF